MTFISVTRLRVRSWRFIPQFVWQALKTGRQAESAAGFTGGRLLREARNAFWTITAWENKEAMVAYRNGGAHRQVMPRLLEWCDEASVVHWDQDDAGLPDWQEAHRRMVAEGRPSKVKHPSPDHQAHRITPPRPGRVEQVLKPAHPQRSGKSDELRSHKI